jgi:lipid II:glycine glycyltransferase (peptidoglycan interpeptide bridge formation enzyme)
MTFREINEEEKDSYNRVVNHVIQSWEWGEFRKKIGLDLVRIGHFEGNKLKSAYQLTLHPVPFVKYTIGYLPKGAMPTKTMVDALTKVGIEKNTAFIKIEPNVEISEKQKAISEKLLNFGLIPSKKSLFTKYNFLVDLTKSEDQLLDAMHQKTRYNIKVAQKKGVEVYESTKDSDFEVYLKLYFETTKRQKYFGHTPHYHRLVWETLKPSGMARVLIGKYQKKALVAWMLLSFGDTMYYPYGGSSVLHKEAMASNLVAWEAIKLARKMGFKNFDMWGALPPDATDANPWYGFHRFKAGYGPKHVEYVGTYDLVLRPTLYNLLNFADRARWTVLRATRR